MRPHKPECGRAYWCVASPSALRARLGAAFFAFFVPFALIGGSVDAVAEHHMVEPRGATHQEIKHHEGKSAPTSGCTSRADGGYVCHYELPPNYDSKLVAEEKRMEVFEGCLKTLYDSCRARSGSRSCGWTAKISCRALSEPPNAD